MNKTSIGKDNKCSGCTACASLCSKSAISFKNSEDGFLYPVIDNVKCINCHLCEKTCPWIMADSLCKPSNHFVAAKMANFKKRLQSQSGGAFTVFAEYFLKNNGVVYGVEFINNKARYVRATSFRKLVKLKGSKYVQAEVGNIFLCVADDLIKHKMVLFSGTACHVDGLIYYLKQRKIDSTNLITIDIICHGVVSPMIFNDYKKYIENLHGGILKRFNFRDKSFGWHGHYVTYKIGSNIYKSKDYVNIFYSSYALRKTCFECQYSNLNRTSDITVGDSWGIGKYFPEFDDNKGCSLIILNSKKGEELFDTNKYKFNFVELKKEMALQPNLEHPTEKPADYDDFWNDYFKFGFEYVAYKYCEFNPFGETIVLKKHQIVKRFIKIIDRIFGFK